MKIGPGKPISTTRCIFRAHAECMYIISRYGAHGRLWVIGVLIDKRRVDLPVCLFGAVASVQELEPVEQTGCILLKNYMW